YFSEYALIKYRVLVEIEYFISLCSTVPQLQTFDSSYISKLQEIYISFTEADAQKVKEIEKTTNHDVKAVEYFIKQKFDALGVQEFKEFIHFGLTSQDINNTAIPYSLKDAIETVILPQLNETINTLTEMATEWEALPMLARTHGQPASPTRLGKEIAVF